VVLSALRDPRQGRKITIKKLAIFVTALSCSVFGVFPERGVVFGPDGAFYISHKSVLAGLGEVLRFEP
jgi:hypothetical protein